MKRDYVEDMEIMHDKFGVRPVVEKLDNEKLKAFLEFRVGCLQEELDELKLAVKTGDKDGIVDAVIDLTVFAVGTLDLFDIDGPLAWKRVYDANMAKEVGIKEGRPNPYGLPDLIKKPGWVPPSHIDNVGLLDRIFPE